MSNRVHRVGIIGCGWFAPFHLAALAALRDRVTIVWAADPDEHKALRWYHSSLA